MLAFDHPECPDLWNGVLSHASKTGPITQFIRETLPPGVTMTIPTSDGFEAPNPARKPQEKIGLPPDAPLIGALCTRGISRPNIVLLPLDDATFARGLQLGPLPPWEARIPKVFWRGSCSGTPFVRADAVRCLMHHPHADVKLIRQWTHHAPHLGPEFFSGGRIPLTEFLRYKYILILDGAVISSAHMWPFGSGAVPLLVTHPDNDYWFKSQLEPWKHQVPVSYDLEDLDEALQWLVEHDAEARQIAEQAQELATRIFSPEFQREHLKRAIFSAVSIP